MGLIGLVQLPQSFREKRSEVRREHKMKRDILLSKFEQSQDDDKKVAEADEAKPCMVGEQVHTDQMWLQFKDLYDTAKIFNRDARSQIQIPFDTLITSELNLMYKKAKGSGHYAFSEAKVSMALFHRWLDLKNGMSAEHKAVDQDLQLKFPKKMFDVEKENVLPLQ